MDIPECMKERSHQLTRKPVFWQRIDLNKAKWTLNLLGERKSTHPLNLNVGISIETPLPSLGQDWRMKIPWIVIMMISAFRI